MVLLALLLLQNKGGLVGYAPLILLVLAILLFGIATFWRTDPPASWNKLVAGGLFCCALYALIVAVGGLM